MKKIKTRFEFVYEFKESEGEYYVNTPAKALGIVKRYIETVSEEMWCFYFNVKNKLMYAKLIAKGSYNSLCCVPADIIRPALMVNCNHLIIAHSHPSGEIEPSEEDIVFTGKIEKAVNLLGLHLLDHLIITENNYYSFKANNVI